VRFAYLDVKEVLGQHGRTVIDGLALAVELTAQHLSGDGHLQHVAGELAVGMGVIDVGGTLEDLQHAKQLVTNLIRRGENARIRH